MARSGAAVLQNLGDLVKMCGILDPVVFQYKVLVKAADHSVGL